MRFHQELDAKPALVDAGAPPVDFNLSHSLEWVALAIGVGTTVGIDIEVKAPRHDLHRLVERNFSAEEHRAGQGLSGRRPGWPAGIGRQRRHAYTSTSFAADGAVHNEPENPMKFRNKKVAVLIDVRSRLEFFFGRMPGAICIPLTKINAAALESRGIARDAGILVYCASGSRSAVAAHALKQAGFTRVMDGGGMAEVRKNLRED